MVYEHLMCDAFKCKRGSYPFVNADCYDGIMKHTAETVAYIETALIVLAGNEPSKREKIQKYICMIGDADNRNAELADTVLCGIYNDGIVY